MHWRLQGEKIIFLYNKKNPLWNSSFESKFQKEKEVGLVRKINNKYLIIDLRYRHNEMQLGLVFFIFFLIIKKPHEINAPSMFQSRKFKHGIWICQSYGKVQYSIYLNFTCNLTKFCPSMLHGSTMHHLSGGVHKQ